MTLSGRFGAPAPSMDANRPRGPRRRQLKLALTWEVERSGPCAQSKLAEMTSRRSSTHRARTSSSTGARSAKAK
jgi:hypothetical protein